MDSQVLVNLALVLVFVLAGGVFAATEIALVSLRDSQLGQLERSGHRGARVAAVAHDPNRFLAAVQIGVTVAGFFSAAYGGATLAPAVSPSLEALGLPEAAAETTALVLMTLFIAYLSLVLGELVPKRLALQRSAGLAVLVTPTLDRFATLMRPVVWLLSVSTNAVIRLVGGDPQATSEQVSEEELRDLVSTHQGLGEHEREMLRAVLTASRRTLKEVMRPRGDVVFLDADMPVMEAAALVREHPYSRYPVVGEGFDDVVGFLHVRDLIDVGHDDHRLVRDVRRDVLVLPATNLVLPAVKTMREEGVHLGVVIDEYGGTDGIVTLEDLVEEIVGDIRDEYDPRGRVVDEQPGRRQVPGGLSLEDFAEETGLTLADGEYETVAGYLIACLGRIPEVGDAVDVDGHRLAVAEMSGRRVTRVDVLTEGGATDPI